MAQIIDEEKSSEDEDDEDFYNSDSSNLKTRSFEEGDIQIEIVNGDD